ncbi:MAG: ABC transporter ATP-binding protein [Thermoproteus sp.]|nr:ABC transporter ATP-binding protein [Thermoproteus sp.]
MALRVESLESGYGKLQVLFGVSLAVRPGSLTALLGPNGAGKTTTLLAIMGIVKPWRGSVKLGDLDLTDAPIHRKIEAGLALVPEGRRLFPDMTVEENLLLGAYTKRARERAGDTMEFVFGLFPRLRERRRQKAGTLSGGEQQMLAVARGLMSLPKVLMIDEPSAGLAPKVVEEMFAALATLRERASVLLAEQNVSMAIKVSDYVYVIEGGRIALEGRPEEVTGEEKVKAYLGL